jgi:murein DD-endopeptidase MepM/ murein hydrolase activator NlpD
MSEGRRPERLCGAAARGRDLMAKPFLIALLLVITVATAAAADDAVVQRASVSPQRGFTDSVSGVRVAFRLAGSDPAEVTIRIAGRGKEVREIDVPGARPDKDLVERWDGLTHGGRPVADGTYKVVVAAAGGNRKVAGKVTLRRHFFPVRGPHGTRGAVGEFNAPRNGGRRHKGFDVTGRCGTPLAAVTAGTVVKRAYDPRLDGNFIVIRGLGERRKYWYAHMVHPSRFHGGDLVHVGQVVGRIGRTGNAGSTPCHLHFEVHRNGRPIDPRPFLRAWDRYS